MALSFSLGVLATSSPCVLPLYPGFLAYLANRSNRLGEKRYEAFLGLIVLFGVLSAMLLVGVLVAALATTLSNVLKFAIPLVNLVLLSFGIVLLSNMDVGRMFPSVSVPFLSSSFSTAYLYGLLFGPIVLPCNAPLVLSMFFFSATVHDFTTKLLVFLAYGLDIGLPLLILSILGQKARGGWLIKQFTVHHGLINRTAGLILIGLAVYNLAYPAQVLKYFR